MLKKYYLTISVTFWTLITAIVVLLTLSQLLPDFKLPGFLSGISGKTNIEDTPLKVPEKEKVYIAQTQYLEVEKKIEWFYFVATGYSADDAAQGTGQKTSTGKNVFEGIIAVDPKIIPYGTKLRLKTPDILWLRTAGQKLKATGLTFISTQKQKQRNLENRGFGSGLQAIIRWKLRRLQTAICN